MQCPRCSSTRLYRDGLRYLADGTTVQRWLCRNCGYRFTDSNYKKRGRWKNPPFSLNLQDDLNHDCQGNNDPARGGYSAVQAVQTLVGVESRVEGAQREGTEFLSQQKIVEFIWYMKKNGYAEATIQSRVRLIKRLAKLGADLYDPESVKQVIAKQPWSNGRKDLA